MSGTFSEKRGAQPGGYLHGEKLPPRGPWGAKPAYYQPKALNERHRVLMRALATGHKLIEAAQIAGFTLGRASVVASSPLFKSELERMRASMNQAVVEKSAEQFVGGARKVIFENLEKAARKVVEKLDSGESDSIQLKAASDLLDRAGIREKEKVEMTSTHITIDSATLALLDRIKQRSVPTIPTVAEAVS